MKCDLCETCKPGEHIRAELDRISADLERGRYPAVIVSAWRICYCAANAKAMADRETVREARGEAAALSCEMALARKGG